jgi:Na+/H+-dicarboxylate symporter
MKNKSNRVFFALVFGALSGAFLNHFSTEALVIKFTKYVLDPAGQVFLRGLFLVVVPLVFSSLVVGVARLGSLENIKTLGRKLGSFYFITTLIAVLVGQMLVVFFKPGQGMEPSVLESYKAEFSTQMGVLVEKSSTIGDSLWPGFVYSLIPKNIFAAFVGTEMLGIIFSALVFGMALAMISEEKNKTLIQALDAVSEAMIQIVNLIMKWAPIAVFSLVAATVSRMGADFVGLLFKFVGVVFAGYALHFFGIYGFILKFLIGMNPLTFYKKAMPVFATSFSTSSSNATIPTTIRVLETEFQTPPQVTRFGIPLGATVNMDGTALFEMVAAIFIAQVFGIELGVFQHISLIFLVVATSIGVAGVPGASIPLLMSAMALVGIPPEGIALILGVDRLLDMGRTVLNVTGDMVAILYVTRKIPRTAKSPKTLVPLNEI